MNDDGGIACGGSAIQGSVKFADRDITGAGGADICALGVHIPERLGVAASDFKR